MDLVRGYCGFVPGFVLLTLAKCLWNTYWLLIKRTQCLIVQVWCQRNTEKRTQSECFAETIRKCTAKTQWHHPQAYFLSRFLYSWAVFPTERGQASRRMAKQLFPVPSNAPSSSQPCIAAAWKVSEIQRSVPPQQTPVQGEQGMCA